MEPAALTKKIKTLSFELKRDPRARKAVRPLVLALALSMAMVYVMNTMLNAPQEKMLEGLKTKIARLEQAIRDRDLLTAGIVQLERQSSILENKLKGLELKRKILLLEQSANTDQATFRRIVLGIGPSPPDLHSFGLVKIVRQSRHSAPVLTLEGEMRYEDLLKYLAYLQKRRELGYMGSLEVTEGFCKNDRSKGVWPYSKDVICLRLEVGKELVVSEGDK